MKNFLVIKGQNCNSTDEDILLLLETAGYDKTGVVIISAPELTELDITVFSCVVILVENGENLPQELQDVARHCANQGLRVIYLLDRKNTRTSIGGTNYGPSVPWSAETLCDVIENDDFVYSVSPKGDIVKPSSTAKGVNC